MHDCLTITEILSIIFDNLYDETGEIRVLASLARTCQAFTEPALDILWQDQLTLVPLIKCFPRDILGASDNGDVQLLRAPQPKDWDRFDYYAPRIRRFGRARYFHWTRAGHGARAGHEYDAVFDLLSKYRTTFLPSVRDCVFDLRMHRTPVYRLYLGPALTSVEISATFHDEFRLDLLRSDLVSLCPQIQHLSVYFLHHNSSIPRVDALVSTFICSLRNLHSITSPVIRVPQSVLAPLATQPSLTTLRTIYVPSSDVRAFTAARFSSLKRFHLRTDDWCSATTILSSMDCTFTALSVECLDNSEPLPAIRSLLATLRPSFETLTTISLESRKATIDSFDAGIEALNTIRPLLSCNRLRVVILHLAFLEALDDSWLLETAGAWPLLESLSLLHLGVDGVPRPGKPKMTLKGLVSLIRDFPRLQTINLSLRLHEADISLLDGVPTGHIRRLRVSHPPVQGGTSEKLWATLPNTFPELRLLRAGHLILLSPRTGRVIRRIA